MPRKIHLSIVAMTALLVATAIAQTFLPAGSVGGTPPTIYNRGPGPRWIEPSTFTGAAVETAILTAYRTGARVYLPGGDYRITETIDLTRIGPVVIEGEVFAATDGFRGPGGVMLNWLGAPGGTMLRMNGLGVQMKNITFNGKQAAGMGVQLFTTNGFGTAYDSFERVLFTGMSGPCFQAGREPKDVNSADVYFDKCIFERSDMGIRVVHDQGVNFHVDGCQFSFLKTALQIDRGGGVYLRGGGGGYCDVFLRTGDGGHNTGPITIRDYRFEYAGYTRKWAQMLDAPDSGGGVRVLFDCLQMADGELTKPDSETPIMKIGGNVSVHVRDSLLKRAGNWPLMVLGGGEKNPSELVLENSGAGFNLKDSTLIQRKGNARLKIVSADSE